MSRSASLFHIFSPFFPFFPFFFPLFFSLSVLVCVFYLFGSLEVLFIFFCPPGSSFVCLYFCVPVSVFLLGLYIGVELVYCQRVCICLCLSVFSFLRVLIQVLSFFSFLVEFSFFLFSFFSFIFFHSFFSRSYSCAVLHAEAPLLPVMRGQCHFAPKSWWWPLLLQSPEKRCDS